MRSNFVGIEIELAINLETVVDGRQKLKSAMDSSIKKHP